MSSAIQSARQIFLDHKGILRSSEARRLGIHPQTLSRMLDTGILLRLERGLYQLVETLHTNSHPELLQVSKLVPKAVIFLLSALNFHGMTTQIPRKVFIALPRGTWKPSLESPPLEIFWLSSVPYSSGIEKHQIGGLEVAIYSPEKTVADCFKFREKIGEDIAIEALGDYLRRSDRNIDRLLNYAEILRVRKRMEPYLKALA